MSSSSASPVGLGLERPERPWATPRDELREALATDLRRGLSADEVRRRRAQFGPNILRRHAQRSLWRILWDQVASPVVLLLVAAMAAALAFRDWIDASAVAVVLVVNTLIGFATELRARRSMESLRAMGQAQATVVRDGDQDSLPADQLVPGDVLVLESGDVVSADVRLVELEALQIDESALTGESVPVDKSGEAAEVGSVLAERTSMAFKGTAVTSGSARGIVVATGMDTELGHISEMVEGAESETTPLQQQLQHLAHRLVWLTLVVVAAVMGLALVAERALMEMIDVGIALAVAAIPEGLPVVATIALATGMHRMARRNALVRRLAAVHTLGAATVICTDKTGTLTANRMHVRTVHLSSGSHEVGDASADLEHNTLLREALEVAALCNTAELDRGGDGGDGGGGGDTRRGDGSTRRGGDGGRDTRRGGDPMEVALLRLARDHGLDRDALLERLPRTRLEPFARETNMMASLHALGGAGAGGLLVAVKGAPESVLEACTRVRCEDGDEAALDEAGRAAWHEVNEALAARGMRMLALACKRVDDADADPYTELHLLGLVGLIDPPREAVPDAIRRCREAGIRVVMVTGDQPATASAIARDVGLLTAADEADAVVLRGDELEARAAELTRATVLARVDPAQKLHLIDQLQREGEIVAMTGDGVNDAPALKKADIGIAMGERGTEVARDAADVVLLDDAFDTIVAAIRQGRIIFDNIRKFVVYLLSGNVGEILAVGAAAATAAPLPLTALQILYLNMVNDVFPALALGVGPGGEKVLERPPRDPAEAILGRREWTAVFVYGLIIAAAILGVFFIALEILGLSRGQAVTTSFLTLSLGRLVHTFNMRAPNSGVLSNEITRNRWMWLALSLCLALLALAVYVTPVASVLGLEAPQGMAWLLIGGGSLLPLVCGQLWLLARGRNKRAAATGAHGAGSARPARVP